MQMLQVVCKPHPFRTWSMHLLKQLELRRLCGVSLDIFTIQDDILCILRLARHLPHGRLAISHAFLWILLLCFSSRLNECASLPGLPDTVQLSRHISLHSTLWSRVPSLLTLYRFPRYAFRARSLDLRLPECTLAPLRLGHR